MKGGGESPKPTQAAAPPTETDPSVQSKKAARLTQARYAKGFMSTMQSSGQGGQGGLGGGIATGSQPIGSVQKLG